jgi:capsular exopolysaccharide synthesis family protein
VGRQSPIQLRLQSNVLSLDDADRSERAALTFVGTQATALQSRDLAERVIRSYGLADNPVFLEPATHRSGPLTIGHRVQGPFKPRGLDPLLAPVPGGTNAEARVDPKLLDTYMRWLSVKQVQGTDLIDVAFVTPSPTLSAFLAGAHAQAYIEANDDVRHATDVVATGFLARKLGDAKKRVKRAEQALDRFASRYPNVAVDREHKVGGQRIAELSNLLTRAEADRVGLEGRYQFLTSPKADPLAYFLDQPGVQKLRLALLDVQAQRAGLDSRLGENHPRMQELKRLEDEISMQLRTEVSRDVASVRAHYDASREREERLHRKLDQQQEAGTEINRLGARYELLKNDVQTARALHSSLLEQQMATAANSDLGASNIGVVERPEVPRRPSRPVLPLNLALGVMGGMLFGVGAAFARDYFDRSVRSGEDAEALVNAPMLATIPRFSLPPSNGHAAALPAGKGAAHHELVVLRDPGSAVAEAFRSMRTALLFSVEDAPRVIVMTSARAAEGKTVTSVNLATALAQCGSSVLLIEADLRHPRSHRLLGVAGGPGLSTLLAGGEHDLDAVIQHVEPAGLALLPSGPLPPNPADLLGSARMRTLLGILRRRYEFIVVDTPPILPVTDAVILAREADGVVMVVKGNDTPRELVRRAHDRLAQTGARCLGVIVNDVVPGPGDPYLYDPYYTPANGDGAGRGASANGRFAWVRDVAQRARGAHAG